MAIRFRCHHCHQLSSIASRMAGHIVQCPTCGADVVVPEQDQFASGPPGEPESQFAAHWKGSHERQSVVASRHEPGVISDDLSSATATRDQPEDDESGFTIRRPQTDFEEMDLTPMVDVTFLLLIFFMITASFSLHKTIEIPTPDPNEKGAAQSMQTLQDFQKNSVLVEIDAQNRVFVEYEKLSDIDDLAGKLREMMNLKQELVIDAHAEAWHETVIRVIDAANEVGMQKIRLVTRTGQSPG